MAYSPVVQVNIAINAVNLTQAGFGTPIFITAHQQTDDRVIDIVDPDDLVNDYGFETTSAAYKAASQLFANSPSPEVMKIGRRGATTVTNPSRPSDDGTSETFTINVDFPSQSANYSATFNSVGDGSESVQDVCEFLKTALDGQTGFTSNLVATITGTDDSAVLAISAVDDDFTFTVSTLASSTGTTIPTYTNSVTGTESASDCFIQIKEEDSDFYFVTSEARPSTDRAFVDALSSEVQGEDKLYFVASGDAVEYTAEDSTSFFWDAWNSQKTKTITLHHHDALDDYPELKYVGYNASYDAGSVTWANLRLPDLTPSGQETNTDKPLNTSQLGRLIARNCNFIVKDAGVNITRTGITAGGEWIDVIRGVHWLTEDMTVALKSLLFNQQGGKVPYTNAGIARIREVCQSSLQRAVNRGFLDSYTLTVPLISEVSTTDFVDRVLRNVTFTGILAGAIHQVEVEGQVTTPNAA